MVGFDDALNILENPTRRDILRHLVKEPHYPLQLSELLEVSQQAVVKHLRVLEEAGFVDSESKKSDKGGPPRKVYRVNQSFSIRLDLSKPYKIVSKLLVYNHTKCGIKSIREIITEKK